MREVEEVVRAVLGADEEVEWSLIVGGRIDWMPGGSSLICAIQNIKASW